MEEELIEKVTRDAKRKAELEVFIIRLAQYSTHEGDCASGGKDEKCSCGLAVLLEQVDTL